MNGVMKNPHDQLRPPQPHSNPKQGHYNCSLRINAKYLYLEGRRTGYRGGVWFAFGRDLLSSVRRRNVYFNPYHFGTFNGRFRVRRAQAFRWDNRRERHGRLNNFPDRRTLDRRICSHTKVTRAIINRGIALQCGQLGDRRYRVGKSLRCS